MYPPFPAEIVFLSSLSLSYTVTVMPDDAVPFMRKLLLKVAMGSESIVGGKRSVLLVPEVGAGEDPLMLSTNTLNPIRSFTPNRTKNTKIAIIPTIDSTNLFCCFFSSSLVFLVVII